MKAIETHHQGIYCKDIDESIRWYCDVFNFRHLFSTETMEGDKPLKMAWIKNDGGIIIELLETADKSCVEANAHALNHLAIRVENMDEFVALLNEKGVAIEAGPFDALCPFDRPLGAQDNDVFQVYGNGGAHLKIMFFRGPGNERIEAVQDDIAPIE